VDAISITKGNNIIVDHCSASWSVDECFSCSTGDKNTIDSVTVQWSIISEALENSIHEKGPHSYGALIRGCYGAKYTYHHNLFAHNRSRNPRPGNYDENSYVEDPEGLLFDFRNNVLYNWGGSRPGYDGDSESVCRYNYIGNYGKPGPDSDDSGYAYNAGCKHFRGYYDDNYFFGEILEDQWSLVRFKGNWSESEKEDYKQSEPFPAGPIKTDSPIEAYDKVLSHAGASLVRDKVDLRVINEVKNGTGSIIDDEDEVGGWSNYESHDPKPDSDMDGMPDEWEIQNDLDPNNAEDRNGDPNNDGYTNLEVYINNLVVESLTVDIENFSRESSVHIYPNPNQGKFWIDLGKLNQARIELYNSNSQLVFTQWSSKGLLQINLKEEPGLYFLRVIDNKKNISTLSLLIQ
jgi:hypothetical protein